MNENYAAAAVVLGYVGFRAHQAIKHHKAHQERMANIRNLEDHLVGSINNLRENLNLFPQSNDNCGVTVIDITRN